MCGIAGIIGHIVEPNRAALKRMSNALLHRGPDGDGYWEASPDQRGWGAMLAFRRLSILDLSPAAMQPMVDPVTGDVVVFNGEIYNYVALRDRLVATGHKFQSSGDTAVMLRALSIHGRQAVCGFRGMFAFAHWNVHERKLVGGTRPAWIGRYTSRGFRTPRDSGRFSSPLKSEPSWPEVCSASLGSIRAQLPPSPGTVSW